MKMTDMHLKGYETQGMYSPPYQPLERFSEMLALN
jgi:hypothetical protein